MADTVQYRLERMSDELDDLERRGLFTRAELAEVVRRRRDFEFRLRRHSPLRADFLDYIAYELRLDALRDLRKRAIIRATPQDEDATPQEDGKSTEKANKKKNKWKKSISDIAGVLRVLDIYRMATVRFKGDLDLWFRYLQFCRQKRHGRMKQSTPTNLSSVVGPQGRHWLWTVEAAQWAVPECENREDNEGYRKRY